MSERPTRSRGATIALKVVYWLAVVVISIGILVGLILLLESRDESSLDETRGAGVYLSSTDSSRANAISRSDAP
jgi:hypothetical protein